MDLPAGFQTSFHLLIVKMKQDVVSDVHRRIDHQAAAIYQFFLAEYQKKGGPQGLANTFDQNLTPVAVTATNVQTQTDHHHQQRSPVKMATRSSSVANNTQRQQSSSSSSSLCTRQFYHQQTHNSNWTGDYEEENDCSCADCQVNNGDGEAEKEEEEGYVVVDAVLVKQEAETEEDTEEGEEVAVEEAAVVADNNDHHWETIDRLISESTNRFPKRQKSSTSNQWSTTSGFSRSSSRKRVAQSTAQSQSQSQNNNNSNSIEVLTNCPVQPVNVRFNHQQARVVAPAEQRSQRSRRPRRYHCENPGCEKSFLSCSLLTRHMRYHYRIKPFRCTFPDCGMAFIEQCKAWEHVKKAHLLHQDQNAEDQHLDGGGGGGAGQLASPQDFVETDMELLNTSLHSQTGMRKK